MTSMRILAVLLGALWSCASLADVIKTIQAGATDQTVTVYIFVAADGTCPTGITHDESGMALYYWRHGANAAVAITEATQTVNGAHSDGGFVELTAATCEYRLDLPDAAVASGATAVNVFGTLTSHIVKGGTVQLVAYNPQDSVRLGLTALPNAAADAAGGLPISDAGGLDLDAQIGTDINTLITEVAKVPKSDSNVTFNATAAAQLQAEANDALVANHLDHLLAATYDPASKPGAADALLNELVESDGGVARFTANALEEAPTGGGDSIQGPPFTTIATAGSTTTVTLTAAPNDDTQLPGFGIYIEDNGDADSYCLRKITSVSSATITYDSACPFTVAAGDVAKLLPAFLNEGVSVAAFEAAALANMFDTDSGEEAGDAVAGSVVAEVGALAASGGLSAADIVDEFETQSTADPTGFRVNVMEIGGTAQTANDNGADINAILVDTGATLQDELDGIEASTDNLPSDPADASVVAGLISGLNNVSTVEIQTLLDAGVFTLGFVNAAGWVCTMTLDDASPNLTPVCVAP